METAQQLFELMGGDSGKLDGPPPAWDKQPEHLKDVFRAKVKPGNRFYHYGLNVVFAIRGDGSLYSFSPMTNWEARQHPSSHRAPQAPSQGHKDLQAILVLEDQMSTIAVRISDKEERRIERARLQNEIYEIWRKISPQHVSRQVLMELYEAHVHKGPEVRLPEWMQVIADRKRESEDRNAAHKAWLDSMTEEDRKEYFDSRDVKDYEGQCRKDAVDVMLREKYPKS
jgi:hypothetical protein